MLHGTVKVTDLYWNCGLAANCRFSRWLHLRKQTVGFHCNNNGSTSTVHVVSAAKWSRYHRPPGQAGRSSRLACLEASFWPRCLVISRPWLGTRPSRVPGDSRNYRCAELIQWRSATNPQFRELARVKSNNFFIRCSIHGTNYTIYCFLLNLR